MNMNKIKRFGELQDQIYHETESWVPLITFSSKDGISIHNPFQEVSGRFVVDPLKEYGEPAIKAMDTVIAKIEADMGISVDEMTAEELRLYIGGMYYEFEKVYPGEFRELHLEDMKLSIEHPGTNIDDTITFHVPVPDRFERFLPEAAREMVMPVDRNRQIDIYVIYDIVANDVSLEGIVDGRKYEANLTAEMKDVLLDEIDLHIEAKQGKTLKEFVNDSIDSEIWDSLKSAMEKEWVVKEPDSDGCYHIEIPADYRDTNEFLLKTVYENRASQDLRSTVMDEIYEGNLDTIFSYEMELMEKAGFRVGDPYYDEALGMLQQKIIFQPDYDHFMKDDMKINLMIGTSAEMNSDFVDIHDNLYWLIDPANEDAADKGIEKPDNGLMWLINQQGYTLEDLRNTMKEYRQWLDTSEHQTDNQKPEMRLFSYEDKMKRFRENHSKFLTSVCEELDNQSYSMGCLTVLMKTSLDEYCNMFSKEHGDSVSKEVVLPKDIMLGIFNPWNGSGSLLDLELEKELALPVEKIWNVQIEGVKPEYAYTVNDVYGLMESCWKECTGLTDRKKEKEKEHSLTDRIVEAEKKTSIKQYENQSKKIDSSLEK